MFYEPEKIEPALCCSLCHRRFSGVVKLIPECGNSICADCHEDLREELEKLPAQYTCKVCDEGDHLFPAKGLPNNKSLMNLANTAPSERPLSEQAKKLREAVERVDEEIKRLGSFDPEQYIFEHFGTLEVEVSEAAESAVKHINDIESELLGQIKERRQECLASLKARLSAQQATSEQAASKLQQEIGKVSREASEFVLKWNDFFQRVNSTTASEEEVPTALDQAQAVLDEIKKCEEAFMMEATSGRKIRFEVNDLFLKTRDHLGKLASYSVKEGEFIQKENCSSHSRGS